MSQPHFKANMGHIQVLPNPYLSILTLKPLRTKIQKIALQSYNEKVVNFYLHLSHCNLCCIILVLSIIHMENKLCPSAE